MDTTKSLSRSTWAFFSGTFLSRITGLGRDISMAFCFGSHPAIAAFMVAFRFSNLFRRLIGEGPMPAGFIPHFEALRALDPKKGGEFFRDFIASLSAIALFFILAGEGGLYAALQWSSLSPEAEEIILFTMLMLPGLFFICLFGLTSALLHCEKKFFLPSIAPIAFNIVWMIAALSLQKTIPSEAAFKLSIALIFAYLMQWALLIPKALRILHSLLSSGAWLKAKFFSAEFRAVVKPLFYTVLGVGAMQINSALDALFARFADLQGPAYLWYAIRIQQLPLALFAIALSSALLPPLARAIHQREHARFRELMHFSLKRCYHLMIPCTAALFLLGASGINLLYGHGRFDESAASNTLLCLWGYGLGLLPATLVLLFSPAFYAKKEYRIPMYGALFSVILNILLNAAMVFIFHWGALSIALSTSAASLFNSLFLASRLRRQSGSLIDRALLGSIGKITLCTLIAAGGAFLAGNILFNDPSWNILLRRAPIHFSHRFFDQLLSFLSMGGIFVATLLLSAWLLNAKDFLELVNMKKREKYSSYR